MQLPQIMSQNLLSLHAKGKWEFVMICQSTNALFRCTNNEIACIKGTAHSKSCLACVKAKQKCKGATFPKVKKPTRSNVVAAGAEAIVAALADITKILQGVRSDLRGLTLVVKECWGCKR
jgi:hypothetical protein